MTDRLLLFTLIVLIGNVRCTPKINEIYQTIKWGAEDRSIKIPLNPFLVYLLKQNSNLSTHEYCFCYHDATPCLIRNTRKTPRTMRNCVE